MLAVLFVTNYQNLDGVISFCGYHCIYLGQFFPSPWVTWSFHREPEKN